MGEEARRELVTESEGTDGDETFVSEKQGVWKEQLSWLLSDLLNKTTIGQARRLDLFQNV